MKHGRGYSCLINFVENGNDYYAGLWINTYFSVKITILKPCICVYVYNLFKYVMAIVFLQAQFAMWLE